MDQLVGKPVPLTTHPRHRTDLPEVGVFQARGPERPNPIGLAVVELLKRDENILTIKALDAYDGTPVLDIKPYDAFDAITELPSAAIVNRRNGPINAVSDTYFS